MTFYSFDSLPPFALADDAFDPIHRTVRTSDLPIRRDVIPLHHVAPHFPGTARAQAFVALLLTGLGLPLASRAAAPLERFVKEAGAEEVGN